MKYFTPELYARGNSRDESVVHGIEDEWDRAVRRYQQHWDKIKAAFPKEVRRFEETKTSLHDAVLLHMAQEADRFVMILESEPPAQNLVILTFTLTSDPIIEANALPKRCRSARASWLYEEFDVDRRKRCCFEVLLSNGWSVKLRFRDFQFLMAQMLVPATNGQVGRTHRASVTRSA